MTLNELDKRLGELGISKNKYYLYGLYGSLDDNDKLALTIKKGNYNIEYEVYYKEKGDKTTIKVFVNEKEACQYFYKRLKKEKELEDKIGSVPDG